MKALLTVLLVLTATQALAKPSKIISTVCSYEYVEGVKIEKSNGRVARECILRESIRSSYLTSVDTKCARGFTEGRKYRYSGNFDSKECLEITKLDEIYEVNIDAECAPGFETDKVANHYRFDYSTYVCVRKL